MGGEEGGRVWLVESAVRIAGKVRGDFAKRVGFIVQHNKMQAGLMQAASAGRLRDGKGRQIGPERRQRQNRMCVQTSTSTPSL